MGQKTKTREGFVKNFCFFYLILINILEYTMSPELYFFKYLWANLKNGPDLSLFCREKLEKIRTYIYALSCKSDQESYEKI